MTAGVCVGCFQQYAYMLFYKRLTTAPRDTSSVVESKRAGQQCDVSKDDVNDGDDSHGSGTDDDFVVYGHDDVAWTGMYIDYFYNAQ